jgi:hypothetical protein
MPIDHEPPNSSAENEPHPQLSSGVHGELVRTIVDVIDSNRIMPQATEIPVSHPENISTYRTVFSAAKMQESGLAEQDIHGVELVYSREGDEWRAEVVIDTWGMQFNDRTVYHFDSTQPELKSFQYSYEWPTGERIRESRLEDELSEILSQMEVTGDLVVERAEILPEDDESREALDYIRTVTNQYIEQMFWLNETHEEAMRSIMAMHEMKLIDVRQAAEQMKESFDDLLQSRLDIERSHKAEERELEEIRNTVRQAHPDLLALWESVEAVLGEYALISSELHDQRVAYSIAIAMAYAEALESTSSAWRDDAAARKLQQVLAALITLR